MTRWKAAAIHLSISALIGVTTGALLFGLWYPPPYFHAEGADELILLLVGVDLTLGPLLTLIVFRSGKRGLKFDLALIGLAQTAALVYGVSVVLQSRPVFLVGVLDRFVMVAANEITDADLAQALEPRFSTRSWTGPRLAGTLMPTGEKERSDVAFEALAGRDVQNQPKYYRDYAEAGKTLLAKAKSLDTLEREKPKFKPLIESWLAKSGHPDASIVWLPLRARKDDMVMLVDAKTAKPLQALAIDPW